jgi:hypothetical protein
VKRASGLESDDLRLISDRRSAGRTSEIALPFQHRLQLADVEMRLLPALEVGFDVLRRHLREHAHQAHVAGAQARSGTGPMQVSVP